MPQGNVDEDMESLDDDSSIEEQEPSISISKHSPTLRTPAKSSEIAMDRDSGSDDDSD